MSQVRGWDDRLGLHKWGYLSEETQELEQLLIEVYVLHFRKKHEVHPHCQFPAIIKGQHSQ